MICHSVQSGTGAPTISLPGGNKFRPFSAKTRMTLWSNVPYSPTGSDDVDNGKTCIPSKESDVVNDFEENKHRWKGYGRSTSKAKDGCGRRKEKKGGGGDRSGSGFKRRWGEPNSDI